MKWLLDMYALKFQSAFMRDIEDIFLPVILPTIALSGILLVFLGVIRDKANRKKDLSNYIYSEEKSEYDRKLSSLASERTNNNTSNSNNTWKCNKCGAMNSQNQSTCNCGMTWMKNKSYLEERKKQQKQI